MVFPPTPPERCGRLESELVTQLGFKAAGLPSQSELKEWVAFWVTSSNQGGPTKRGAKAQTRGATHNLPSPKVMERGGPF